MLKLSTWKLEINSIRFRRYSSSRYDRDQGYGGGRRGGERYGGDRGYDGGSYGGNGGYGGNRGRRYFSTFAEVILKPISEVNNMTMTTGNFTRLLLYCNYVWSFAALINYLALGWASQKLTFAYRMIRSATCMNVLRYASRKTTRTSSEGQKNFLDRVHLFERDEIYFWKKRFQ